MTLRDPAVQPLDPNNIFVGAPGDPLANQHIGAHQQIKDEIVLNDQRLTYLESLLPRIPQGRIGSLKGPAAQTDVGAGGSTMTVLALNVTLPAARRCRVSAFGRAFNANGGINITNAAINFIDEAAVSHTIAQAAAIPPMASALLGNVWMAGAIVWETINLGGPLGVTYALTGVATNGNVPINAVLRFNPNTCQLIVEDMGPAVPVP